MFDDSRSRKLNLYKDATSKYNLSYSAEDMAFPFVKEKITNINLNQKNAFNYSRCRKMNDLRRKSPRDLLKIFKIKICSVPWEEISNSDLKEYFCNLMSENEENNEYEVFANNIDGRNYDNCTFESPDECITDKGIMKAIKKLGVN